MHTGVEADQTAFVLDHKDADGDALNPLGAKEDPQQWMEPAVLNVFDVNVTGASSDRATPPHGGGSLAAQRSLT
jgi:hypothetical protein